MSPCYLQLPHVSWNTPFLRVYLRATYMTKPSEHLILTTHILFVLGIRFIQRTRVDKKRFKDRFSTKLHNAGKQSRNRCYTRLYHAHKCNICSRLTSRWTKVLLLHDGYPVKCSVICLSFFMRMLNRHPQTYAISDAQF